MYIRLIDSTLRENEYLFRLNDQQMDITRSHVRILIDRPSPVPLNKTEFLGKFQTRQTGNFQNPCQSRQ